MRQRLQINDVQEPNLLREVYSYADFPKLQFDNQIVEMDLPDSIWLTDTTFRDGQQAGAPFLPQQILKIFDHLHQIDGGSGLIRQTEFFLYSQRDRRAVESCRERGYRFPEIIGWIRAKPSDLRYVRQAGLKETGLLMSVSDYHIFLKLGLTRQQALNRYLDMVQRTLDAGIIPRCHLEDITRADFDGFVLPLVDALLTLGQNAGLGIKIRLCDTLGLAVPFPQAALPRGVPRMMARLRQLGVPAEQLEWHGHNDFHKAQVNAAAAWLYGCASVNCTLFGRGERTGNPPLEALLVEHAQLKGMHPQVNYAVLEELARWMQQEMGFDIPAQYPLVGSQAHVTCAGIHADGLAKHQEIYNAFDGDRLLHCPARIGITDRSGTAGIAHWIARHLKIHVPKRDPRVGRVKQMIDEVYANGRPSMISDQEMQAWVRGVFTENI